MHPPSTTSKPLPDDLSTATNSVALPAGVQSALSALSSLLTSLSPRASAALRSAGRSRLARKVEALPNEASLVLSLSQADLPTGSVALGLSHIALTISHIHQRNFEDAVSCADHALIMLGSNLATCALELIVELEKAKVLPEPLTLSARLGMEKPMMLAEVCEFDGNVVAEVDAHMCSVPEFSTRFFQQDRPVVLRGVAQSWRGVTRWADAQYLVNCGGHRHVPIERRMKGRAMKEEIVTFHQVLVDMLRLSTDNSTDTIHEESIYLAQHALFEQIVSLKEDIDVPKFVQAGGREKADVVNAWIGSKGSGSSLHFDSADNILVQVVGEKVVRLAPYDMGPLFGQTEADENVAPVDIENVDREKWPRFKEVRGALVRLQPGDGLYMPAKYWHWVKALTTSISVNFWF